MWPPGPTELLIVSCICVLPLLAVGAVVAVIVAMNRKGK